MIEGVQAYAKCQHCGAPCWTEASDQPQSVTCVCGSLIVVDDQVYGPADPAFEPQSLADLIAAEQG